MVTLFMQFYLTASFAVFVTQLTSSAETTVASQLRSIDSRLEETRRKLAKKDLGKGGRRRLCLVTTQS